MKMRLSVEREWCVIVYVMSTFWQQTTNRDLVPTHPRDATKCDTTAQNLSYVVSSSLLNHILHWICFKILFTYSKYLVYNWGYTRLIRTIKIVKKSNKKFKIFRVIIVLCNYHCMLLKLFWAIKGFILYQIKQTTLKVDYNFTTYSQFTDTRWI